MKKYHSEGGAQNPDFLYRVRVKRQDGMLEWCDEYPVTGSGHFQRYYVDWQDKGKWDTPYATFQFEQEAPAIMFALRFGRT